MAGMVVIFSLMGEQNACVITVRLHKAIKILPIIIENFHKARIFDPQCEVHGTSWKKF